DGPVVREVVAVRAARAEGRDLDHHGGRVQRRDALVAEAETLGDAPGVVGDQDVRPAQQAVEDRRRLGPPELDREAALAPVVAGEVEAVAALQARPAAAAALPLRRLDLDHVGAMVAEDHGAVRAGDVVADVEDVRAGQRTRTGHRDGPPFFPATPRPSQVRTRVTTLSTCAGLTPDRRLDTRGETDLEGVER